MDTLAEEDSKDGRRVASEMVNAHDDGDADCTRQKAASVWIPGRHG